MVPGRSHVGEALDEGEYTRVEFGVAACGQSLFHSGQGRLVQLPDVAEGSQCDAAAGRGQLGSCTEQWSQLPGGDVRPAGCGRDEDGHGCALPLGGL